MTEGHPLAAPARLGTLIDYQTGAVVSRVLMRSPGGTVTLFAFDEGQGLSEHTAPFDALVQLLDGNAAITVGGIRHEVLEGQALLLPGGVPHAVDAVSRFRMLLTMIRTPTAAG
jgi:quercetin dioxygenase-like cupin family protein